MTVCHVRHVRGLIVVAIMRRRVVHRASKTAYGAESPSIARVGELLQLSGHDRVMCLSGRQLGGNHRA